MIRLTLLLCVPGLLGALYGEKLPARGALRPYQRGGIAAGVDPTPHGREEHLCRGSSENGLCGSHEAKSPLESEAPRSNVIRPAPKPKVDRASLFRRRKSQKPTTPLPEEDARTTQSLEAEGDDHEDDPCRLSPPTPPCSKKMRQRLSGLRFKPAVTQDTSTSNPPPAITTTTEPPTTTTTRRALPITMARLQKSLAIDTKPTMVPKPSSTVLFSNFYQPGEEPATTKQPSAASESSDSMSASEPLGSTQVSRKTTSKMRTEASVVEQESGESPRKGRARAPDFQQEAAEGRTPHLIHRQRKQKQAAIVGNAGAGEETISKEVEAPAKRSRVHGSVSNLQSSTQSESRRSLLRGAARLQVEQSAVGYEYTQPDRPFLPQVIESRSELFEPQFVNASPDYEGLEGSSQETLLRQRPPIGLQTIPVVEQLSESQTRESYLHPKQTDFTFALKEVEPMHEASSRLTEPVPYGKYGESATLFSSAETSPLGYNRESSAPLEGSESSYSAAAKFHKARESEAPSQDQNPSSNEQSIDYQLAKPPQSAYAARTPSHLNGYALSSAYAMPGPQYSAESLMAAAAQRQREEQQANFAAQAILGALHLQAEMLQRQQEQAEVPANRPQQIYAQSVTPQHNPSYGHSSTAPYEEHQQQNSIISTTERPRDKVPRKKKNKKKNNVEGTSQNHIPVTIDDHAFSSLADGEIVFERPQRDPEIIFDRPSNRKPFKPHVHPELVLNSLRGSVYVDSPRRPPYPPRFVGGPPRPRSKLRTRPPLEVITLHRQKRQDGYIYPKPTAPGPERPIPQPPQRPSEGGAVAPGSTQQEEEGYDYPKPAAPFPSPSAPPSPGPSPTTEEPGPTEGPTPSIGPTPARIPVPEPVSPSLEPEPSPAPSPLPTAPVPVRPKPTPPASLIPTPELPPSEEGYDYQKPDVQLPLPTSPPPPPPAPPKPSPEGDVELPGPPVTPPPSPQAPPEPSPGISTTEGYDYPVPRKPFPNK